MPYSFSFISVMFAIVFFGRGLGTMGFISLLKLCGYEKGNPQRLRFKELIFIWFAGLIRGAIAFGLVLRIDGSYEGRNLIVTTCLALVLITTVLFGSTIGLIGDCLFKDEEGTPEGESNLETENSSDSSEPEGLFHPNKEENSRSSAHTSNHTSLLDDDFQNMGQSQVSAVKKSKKSKGCFYYIGRFDEFCMKPIFIYKYTKNKAKEADDFANDFVQDGGKKVELEFGRSITIKKNLDNKSGGSGSMKQSSTMDARR